jgi:hypothetical protein
MFSLSLSLYVLLPAPDFPFLQKKLNNKKFRVLDMREFEKGTPSSIEMPSLHCQKA